MNQVINGGVTPVVLKENCLFQRNQIFETMSLTAEKVTAARETEEQ